MLAHLSIRRNTRHQAETALVGNTGDVQSSAATPAEFLEGLDDDWRRTTLLQLRDIIQSAAPELDEVMSYKMLGYSSGTDHVFHLNAQKNYVSLYVGDISKIDPDGELTEGLNIGKGCIRLSASNLVAETRISDFVSRAVDRLRTGESTGC